MIVFRFIVALFVVYLLITAYERHRIRKSIENIYTIFDEMNERMID